jgi:hypothetical protein
MRSSSPSPPPAPDPFATAAAQGAANKDAAIASARLSGVNQVTPYGNLTYTEAMGPDGTPRFTATTSLAPAQQQLLDQQNQLDLAMANTANTQFGRVSGALAQPFTMDGLPAVGAPGGENRMRVEQALMDRMNPMLERDRLALEQRLANQGITPGSEAWRRSIDDASRAASDARLAVIAQGGAEESRLYGLESNARERALQEAMLMRQLPLQEAQILAGQSQVQLPAFTATPSVGVGAAPIADSIYGSYQGNLGAYNQQLGQQNAMMGGLFGLGGAALQGLGAGGFFN